MLQKGNLTAYDVQSTECNVAEAVEWLSAYMLLHLLDQNITLFVHHVQEVGEDGEVESRGQHFASAPPLVSCAVACGRQIMRCTRQPSFAINPRCPLLPDSCEGEWKLGQDCHR